MTAKIVFIERKFWRENFAAFSLEKVFEQIAKLLPKNKFETEILKVAYGNSFTDIVKNLLSFRKPQADIYHITGQIHYMALILPTKKTVLTIHDVGFLKNDKKLNRFLIKKLFLDLPVKKLKYITTVSETTRNDIIANTNCDEKKIRVIENPIQEHYLKSEKKPFHKACPTILQIGITPNKNIPNLIRALAGIDCRLRIIGNLTDDLKGELDDSKIVYENAFGLDDEAMRREYENADIVAFCSTFEGFGLPIIEAQAMRTPVITSDLSPMKEVSGGAACLVDPFDVESIREGILKLINDDEFRDRTIADGAKNIQKYQPQRITGQYEELYREILES